MVPPDFKIAEVLVSLDNRGTDALDRGCRVIELQRGHDDRAVAGSIDEPVDADEQECWRCPECRRREWAQL